MKILMITKSIDIKVYEKKDENIKNNLILSYIKYYFKILSKLWRI